MRFKYSFTSCSLVSCLREDRLLDLCDRGFFEMKALGLTLLAVAHHSTRKSAAAATTNAAHA